MSEQKAFLEKVHIENFLSLRDVTLPLKPLTVLVGPNASGKSNVLNALILLSDMMVVPELPPTKFIQDQFWVDEGDYINFQLHASVKEKPIVYDLVLKAIAENPFIAEKLSISNKKTVQVLSIQEGKGVVRDEDSTNETTYESNKLALKSAGAYGNKPITNALAKFIEDWEFYDFQPEFIRRRLTVFSPSTKELPESPKLDSFGRTLPEVLWDWYRNTPDGFQGVSESLSASTKLRIDQRAIDGDNQLCLLEGHKKPVPLKRASDGTLRLVAYYTLLNQPELPPLIAIEEPERNLHPGALMDLAKLLEQIAERTQVIITTHSSQLLDAFNPENLAKSLGILLLRNLPGRGTNILNIENIRQEREAFRDWITDFGIGSAVFDSEILQDLMENST